jgi:hypothetical protein
LKNIFNPSKRNYSCYIDFVIGIIYTFCFFTSSVCFAQAIVLEDDNEISSLGKSLSYFIEKENQNYTIDEISNPDFDIKWLISPSEHLNLGYNPNVVWLKIEVENNSEIEDWKLNLDVAFIDSIAFYQKNKTNTKWLSIKTGWYYPYFTRQEITSNGFIFPLHFSQNRRATFYIRVVSSSPILFPIFISTQKQIIESSQDKHIGYGIYFGILLVICLYNLIIFIMVRDRSYLYYVISIAFTFITFGGVSGYLFKYIYPHYQYE